MKILFFPLTVLPVSPADAKGTIREIVLPKGLDLDRPKRTRTSFTAEQLYRLELEFQRCQYVVGRERTELARQLNLSETQVRPAAAPPGWGRRGGRVPEPPDARSEGTTGHAWRFPGDGFPLSRPQNGRNRVGDNPEGSVGTPQLVVAPQMSGKGSRSGWRGLGVTWDREKCPWMSFEVLSNPTHV